MKQKSLVALSVFIGLLFLIASAGLTEDKARPKTKKELQEEAKKSAEERSKQIEQLEKTQKLSEQIIDQQRVILQQQQALQEVLERTRFQAKLDLEKETVGAGELFPFEFTLTNGSQKTFWVDGRKTVPGYEILDDKGRVVASSKAQRNVTPAKKDDLVKLGPGESMTLKGEGAAPAKAGEYAVRGAYTFAGPEKRETREIWFGGIFTTPVRLKVTEKGKSGR